MNRRCLVLFAPVALLAAAGAARADDLSGSYHLLCSAGDITVCYEDGACEAGSAEELNVPQFIEIDLTAKKLSTTRASGLNRSSNADSVRRVDGSIVLQGFEKGRAYSFVIDEKSGHVAIAVAAPSRGVTAFGSCTPLPASK
jgi:hypothetical protein